MDSKQLREGGMSLGLFKNETLSLKTVTSFFKCILLSYFPCKIVANINGVPYFVLQPLQLATLAIG